jgi:hypothetical protein
LGKLKTDRSRPPVTDLEPLTDLEPMTDLVIPAARGGGSSKAYRIGRV